MFRVRAVRAGGRAGFPNPGQTGVGSIAAPPAPAALRTCVFRRLAVKMPLDQRDVFAMFSCVVEVRPSQPAIQCDDASGGASQPATQCDDASGGASQPAKVCIIHGSLGTELRALESQKAGVVLKSYEEIATIPDEDSIASMFEAVEIMHSTDLHRIFQG